MNKPSFVVGDLVRVTSGIYADAVGEVADMHPECSAVRIHSKDGNVYAFVDAVQKLSVHPKKDIRPLVKK